ncbi:unnamed protein product, partial [Amoebophrya sp. A25]
AKPLLVEAKFVALRVLFSKKGIMTSPAALSALAPTRRCGLMDASAAECLHVLRNRLREQNSDSTPNYTKKNHRKRMFLEVCRTFLRGSLQTNLSPPIMWSQ